MAAKDISIRLSLKDAAKVEQGLQKLGESGQRALAKIQAGSQPASRGLMAINAVTSELRGTMHGMTANLGAVGAGLMALGPGGAAAAVGIGAALVGLKSLLDGARKAVADLDALGDAADRAGVSAEGLQELRYAFEQNGVAATDLDSGLRTLGKNLGDIAAFGKGKAKDALDELGLSVTDVNGQIKSTETILPEIADALSRVSDQNTRMALTQKLVGESAAGMTTLLSQGAGALEKLRADAREMGLVVEETFIVKASEAADRLQTLSTIIDARMNQALVNLAPVLVSVVEGFAGLITALVDVADSFQTLENMSGRGLHAQLVTLQTDLEKLHRLRQEGGVKTIMYADPSELDAEIQTKYDEIQRINDVLAQRAAHPLPKPLASGLTGDSRDKTADPLGDYMTGLNKKISAQETEIGVLEKSAGAQARARAELELNNIVAEENIKLTTSQSSALSVSLNNLESATDRFEQLGESQRAATQRAQAFGDAYVRMSQDVLFESKSMSDALQSLAMSIANIAVTQAFLEPAGKVAGSFLSSMLPFEKGGVMTAQGPVPLHAYSSGGIANSPQLALFGEGKKPEAYVPLPDGRRIPVALSGGGGGGPAQVDVHIHNAPQNTQARARASMGSGGELQIDVFLEQVEGYLARNLSRGEGLARVMEPKYGLSPAVSARR